MQGKMKTNFKRYELKYMLTKNQYELLLAAMPEDMQRDEYGRHKISNIYFDTEDYRIIRNSIEKPRYKEKLRVRCYGQPSDDSTAFVELKKKFNGVVYKRRIYDNQKKVLSYFCNNAGLVEKSQILNEIEYFKNSYDGIKPKVYLSYDREAFFSTQDKNFRLTFDFEIKTRNTNISLYSSPEDKEIIGKEYVVLEVKTALGLPLWFLKFLETNGIYKISFSKYGTAYKRYFLEDFKNNIGGLVNA